MTMNCSKWTERIERYISEGRTVSGSCGASSQQHQIADSQQRFYDQLTQEYGTVFAENQSILKALTASFKPILEAGPNQKGFSEEELQNLESQATTGTGRNYAKAGAALGAIQGAEGGGTAYIPSGAKHQQQEQLAESAAANESGIQSNILAADYETGRQNYFRAAGALGGVAGELNPVGYSNSATGAGSAAANTANQIAQADSSWMNLVAGGLGAAATAYAGCWIAAAVFDGWDDPRTKLVRFYLNTEFKSRWYGSSVMSLYMVLGERLSRCKWLIRKLTPVFHNVLRDAIKFYATS